MTGPQPPVVDAAPPPPIVVVAPRRSLAGELARWSTGGILIGMPLGLAFVFILGLAGFFLGIAVGGSIGLVIAGALALTRGTAKGYGNAKRITHRGAISTWVHVAGLAMSIAVGIVGFASLGFGFAGWGALAGVGALGILSTVFLLFGAAFSPERDSSRTTALVVGPILAIISLGLLAMASSMTGYSDEEAGGYVHPPDPQVQIVETAPAPYGAPEGDLAPSDRIPAPPARVSLAWNPNLLVDRLAESADRALDLAEVDDPDIQANVRFLPTAVQCPWKQNATQATIAIWFDTADDDAAIVRVRDFWVLSGYTVVVDDPDLVVVHSDSGLGTQYSLEKTWDDELLLRMQTTCFLN